MERRTSSGERARTATRRRQGHAAIRHLGTATRAALVCIFVALLAPSAHAQAVVDRYVTSLADDGPGSLRQAIQLSAEGGSIGFRVEGTIRLESPLELVRHVDILGPGASALRIQGAGASRLIDVPPDGGGRLKGLRLSGGAAPEGGAILNYGRLRIEDCLLEENHASWQGGAISNRGRLEVRSSRMTANEAVGDSHASGGALSNFREAEAELVEVVLDGNVAYYSGALSNLGELTLLRSAVIGNTARVSGAAFNQSDMTVANSTVANNRATGGFGQAGGGGAFSNSADGTLRLIHVSLVGNRSEGGQAGGIRNRDGVVEIVGSIIADNGGGNCLGPITDGGHNLQHPLALCGASIPSRNPFLWPLEHHGTSPIFALRPGSPARDAGDPSVCAAPPLNRLDQRGFLRPIDGNDDGHAICDIGAFEADSPGMGPTPTAPPTPTTESTASPAPSPRPSATQAPDPAITPSPTATAGGLWSRISLPYLGR